MLLILGDWSEDGHGDSDNFGCRANKKVVEIQQAYKASCKLTGISFNHNEDFTDRMRPINIANHFRIATNYNESFIHEASYDVLNAYDCPYLDALTKITRLDDTIYTFDDVDSFKHYISIWWWFVTLSLPDLTYEMAIDFGVNDPGMESTPKHINGYWDAGLNVQFGYGLYTTT